MPQQTEISANPPAETKRPEETHSASPPPPARSESYFKLHPQAPMYLAIAAVVLLVAGFFTYRYFSMYESTDDAEVDGHLMPLSARITGYVVKVNVDDNQYVDAGTVLAEIDPRDYQVALDQANPFRKTCTPAKTNAPPTRQTYRSPVQKPLRKL